MNANALIEYAKGQGVTLTKEQCDTMIRNWRANYPEVLAYFRKRKVG